MFPPLRISSRGAPGNRGHFGVGFVGGIGVEPEGERTSLWSREADRRCDRRSGGSLSGIDNVIHEFFAEGFEWGTGAWQTSHE